MMHILGTYESFHYEPLYSAFITPFHHCYQCIKKYLIAVESKDNAFKWFYFNNKYVNGHGITVVEGRVLEKQNSRGGGAMGEGGVEAMNQIS